MTPLVVPKVGDRIRLIIPMQDDPDPVPAGTEGTVTFASPVTMIRTIYVQVGVKWDNGRTLGLVCPPDMYAIID